MNYIKLFSLLFLLNTSLLSNIQLTLKEKEFIKNHPIITLGTGDSWAPYSIKNNDGTISGYDNDILNKINKATGANFIQKQGNWSEMQKLAKQKKLDGLSTLAITDKRKEFFNFSNIYISLEKMVMVKHRNPLNIKSEADLIGKTIVIHKGNGADENAAKQFKDSKIIYANTPLEMLKEVIFGNADATFGNGATEYMLSKEGLPYMENAFALDNSLDLAFAVRKDWPEALSILNKGLSTISEHERIQLKQKWFLTKEESKSKSILTPEEKKYITQKKVIKMCNNPNWEPIEFAVNGNLDNMQGIAIDTIKLLEKKLDIKFENIPTKSWGESQQFLKEKKCDILPCAVETSKRKKYANFTKPYLNLPLAIFTTKDKQIVSGLDEIMDKSWTRQKGSGLITKLKKDYPNMKVIETKGDKEALQYVNSGKAYFTIATLPVASLVISKYMLNDLHIAGYTGMVYNLSMAVRDDDKILLNILDKTLENLSKEESKQIMRKWVDSSVKEPVADYSLIWKILFIVLIIILFFIYRHYVLKRSNIELQIKVKEKTQDLQKLNKNLEIKIKEAVNENFKTQKRLFKSEKMASMGEMIGNIAHQWRQPLSVISSGSTGMKMQKKFATLTDKEFNETCDIINDNAQYLSKTIDDFKNFIKGDRAKTIFILKDDINSFLNLVEGSIKSNNINMILDLQDNIKIDGYENELIQCFINIFNNAKDILKEKKIENKLIFITTLIENNKAVIKIKDNGGGIPKDIINKIFEPYFTTKHKSQGTGLGLHMTYNLIVDGMGGTIEANNVSYEYQDIEYIGAEFTISLPVE